MRLPNTAPAASDAELIQTVRQGEVERYSELVERYQRMLYGIAWSRLGNADLCEDVVQDAFVQAYSHLPFLRQPEKFPAWLVQITRNLCTEVLRRTGTERKALRRWAVEQPMAAEPSVRNGESLEETLSAALTDLSDTDREALVLYYLQRKSTGEGARALGLSESAFRTRLHRARRALRTVLDQRLEAALQNLQPGDRIRSGVMAAVSAIPMGTGISGGGLGALLLKLLPSFLQLGIMYGLASWIFRDVAGNYRSGKSIRRRVLWRSHLTGTLSCAGAVIVLMGVYYRIGPQPVLWTGAVLVGTASLLAFRQYRFSQTPYTRANAISYPVMSVALAAVAAGLLPVSAIFASTLLLYALWYRARASQPFRYDYNLFQRALMEGLGMTQQEDVQGSREPVPREVLRRYAQQLGQLYLIADRRPRDLGIRLYLPLIRTHPVQALLSLPHRWFAPSTIDVDSDGTCKARLSARDGRALRSLSAQPVDLPRLKQQVEQAVEASVLAFVQGRYEDSVRLLQKEDDREVYAVPLSDLRSLRVTYATAAVSAGCFILLLTWLKIGL